MQEFKHPVCIDPRTTFYVTTADQLHDLPPLLPIPGLFPAHRLSLVLGTSGSGLTQLACHIASYLAPPDPNQSAIPDIDDPDYEITDADFAGEEPDVFPSVLLISQRDNADVLKPRLTALGADLRKILILTEVTEREVAPRGEIPRELIRPFQPKDHTTLSQLLRQHKGIGTVLIDNADWMFSATNHPTRAQLQRQLACLEAVAKDREVSIVLLTATPALTANPCRNRLLQCLHDACRAVHLLAPDLEDPSARLLFTLKNTVGTLSHHTRRIQTLLPAYPNPGALEAANGQLEIGNGQSEVGDGESPTGQLAAYTPPPMANGTASNLTYPQYLALRHHPRTRGPAPYQHDFACEVLIEALRNGPLPVGQFKAPLPGTIAHHAKLASVSQATIFRAKKTLQVTSTQTSSGWIWTLPPTIPTLSLPPAIVEPKPLAETCACDPSDSAQLLTPQASAIHPTPCSDNVRTCPVSSAEPPAPRPPTLNSPIPKS